MNVNEVATNFAVEESTVKKWCQKGYIRGVTKDASGNYVIPSSVKKPYTARRAKGDAVYTSIVKATLKGFDVTASLFDINEMEFNRYVEQLKTVGVIDTYTDSDTGIEYLCRTLGSSDFSKLKSNQIKKFFSSERGNVSINVGININK